MTTTIKHFVNVFGFSMLNENECVYIEYIVTLWTKVHGITLRVKTKHILLCALGSVFLAWFSVRMSVCVFTLKFIF